LKPQIGLDKLALLLPTDELGFTPDFPAIVDRPTNAATGELLTDRVLYHTRNGAVSGKSAYYNCDNFNLTIKPHRESGSSICLVHFSAGAYSDSNLQPLNKDQVSECARHVESDLLAVGLRFPVNKAKITRVDLAKNVELSQPVSCYAPVFQAVGARKRMSKKDFGGTGFLMANTQREICFYDKGEEMREKGHHPAICPANTLRPEVRYMKSRVIRNAIGADTLPQLRSAWENLHGAYLQSLECDVFKPKPEQKIDSSLNAFALAHFILESGSNRPYSAFLSEFGRLGFVRDMGLGMAKEFFASNFGIDADSERGERQLRRINADLEKAHFSLEMQDLTSTGKVIKELYRELKARVME
jgi:hypothetical protein